MASEGRRDHFQRYLQETHVKDDLAKILTSLYEEPEKPKDPLRYICNKLMTQTCNETLESLAKKIDEAGKKVSELYKVRSELIKSERHPQRFEPVSHTYKRLFLNTGTEKSVEPIQEAETKYK